MAKTPRRATEPAKPAAITKTAPQAGLGSRVLRAMAATDYITDQQGRSVQFHYERRDRGYAAAVGFAHFKQWSVTDDWHGRRRHFWEEIEVRVREQRADELYAQRLHDLDELTELYAALGAFLRPLRDAKGKIVIDAATNLPVMPLEMPRADQFLRAYLKLHERLLLLRGEVTSRGETLNAEHVPLPPDKTSQGERGPRLSRGETRALVRKMIEQAQGGAGGGGDALRDGGAQVQAGRAGRGDEEAGG